MPYLCSTINELTTHVFFPVVRQLAHRLLTRLNLAEDIGDSIYISSEWSTHYRTTDYDNNVNVGQQGLRIEFQVQMNPTQQKFECYTFYHTTAYRFGHRTLNALDPIYLDMDNRVRIVQMESPVTISMNCELTLVSADIAYQAPLRIFNGYENGSVHEFNDIAYDYPIPKPIISVLFALWKMDRIKGKPAGIPFFSYIQANTKNRFSLLKHREKDQYEIVSPVFNLQTLSVLEYSDDKPQGMMENRLPIGFNIPFTYTVQFGSPTMNIMQFPVVYNNQLVPKECIPQDTISRFNTMREDDQRKAFYMYNKGNYIPTFSVKLPEYDEWVVPSTVEERTYGHKPIVIAHVIVDESKEDYTTEVNLETEFTGAATLGAFVKEMLYQQGSETVRNDVPYPVAVYKDDFELKAYDDVTFNGDTLTVKFKPSNLTSHYRVVLFAPIDLFKIKKKWWLLLGKYYPFVPEPIKVQIKHLFENNNWFGNIKIPIRKPGYNVGKDWINWWDVIKNSKPGDLILEPNGTILDKNNNVIGNITELSKQEEYYAPDTTTRIITTNIIPKRSTKSSS